MSLIPSTTYNVSDVLFNDALIPWTHIIIVF